MNFLMELVSNRILIIAGLGWFIAGVLKVFVELYVHKQLNWKRVFGAGGMPSSHSSTVLALSIAIAHEKGLGSCEFAMACIIAIIVIHDAVGVRQETGKQAKLLNAMVFETHVFDEDLDIEKRLKEYIGHTPSQVLMGAIVGTIVAIVFINILY